MLAITLWAKGAGTGHGLELHFADDNGKGVKVGGGVLESSDWRRIRVKIPSAWPQPITFKSITLHNWDEPHADKATFCFARLEAIVDPGQKFAVTGGLRFTAAPTAPYGLIEGDGAAQVVLKAQSWQPGEKTYEIRLGWTDWQGKTVAGKPLALQLKGNWQQAIDAPASGLGPLYFKAELWERDGKKPVAVAETRIVRVPPMPRLTPEQRLKSPMGVNGHYQSPWGAFACMGIHWGRDYSWGWLKHGEKAPMADNGVDFRLTLKPAEDAGVILLPITMRSFWDDGKKAFIEDEAAIAQAFERLRKAFPTLPYWELDNEADLARPSHRLDLANYSHLIRAAAKGLRAAGKARVALNGTSGIHYQDTLELLKSPVRDDFAVVNYHYYTGTVPPEIAVEDTNTGAEGRRETVSFLDQLRRINRAAHAAGKEAWLTEIGWDVTYGPAVGERLQAIYLPRVYLLARSCGTDKIFWFFDRDVKGSTIKFASSGLLDLADTARPSAAAMAALSLFTAQAEAAGSVDIGDGRWCLLFKKPEGTWVVAAWTVQGEFPLPAELKSAKAFDIFGNPLQPGKLSPEVAYFELPTLPPAWEGQRAAEWLSPTVLTVIPGGKVAFEAKAGKGKLSWAGLPKGVATMVGWESPIGQYRGEITCAPDTVIGFYSTRAVASGDGWKREWPVELRVEPAVLAVSEPYELDKPCAIQLRLAGDKALDAAIEVPNGVGSVEPAKLSLEPGKAAAVKFTAAASARGPVALALALANGVRQPILVRPLWVTVPRAAKIALDGRLDDWPKEARIAGGSFASTSQGFAPEALLAWSPEGLYVAAAFPVKELKSGDPKWFWDMTNLEVFLDVSGDARQGWGNASHQFWFTPIQEDGKWRLYAGEWKRSDAIAATIYDDKRCKTAVAVADGRVTFEALIPKEALGGKALEQGAAWRAGVAVQRIDLDGNATAAWPIAKDGGLLNGAQNLGIIRFTE